MNVMMLMAFFLMINSLDLLSMMSLILLMMKLMLSSKIIISTNMMMDPLSSSLIYLSIWISILSFKSSTNFLNEKNNSLKFSKILMLLMILLVLSFTSKSIFLFYILFEGIFILMFMFVIGWGYSMERYQAATYMLFYTLIVSLPFLLSVLSFFMLKKSLMMILFSMSMNIKMSTFWFFFVVIIFLVKMPMFLTHLWLPKAHVEAPVAGSMILAGVLLKLGGYGIFRIIPLMKKMTQMKMSFIMSISILGAFMVSLICLQQSDMKSLIAYSSVAHMGMVISGYLTSNLQSTEGSTFMMLAHGLTSSALFLMLFYVYNFIQSRSGLVIKGMLKMTPLIIMWIFIYSSMNMGVPPSLPFFSEVFILMGMLKMTLTFILFMSLLMIFAGIYSMYFFTTLSHGEMNQETKMNQLNLKESLMMKMHLFPLILLPLNLTFMVS